MGTQRISRTRVAGRTRTPHLLVVGNRNASGARPGLLDDVASAIRQQGGRADTACTASLDELAEVWPRDPERRVVVIGGDGTVHAAAAIPGPHPELALIPAGGANNVASSLGIPVSPAEAIRVAMTGRPRPLDLIVASTPTREHVAVEGVSIGYLARARERYRAANSAHPLTAAWAGLGALATHRPICVRLELDGEAEILRASQVFVANLARYGPSLRVAPHADADDGLLDVVTLGPRGRLGVVRMMRDLQRGRLHEPLDRVRRAAHVRISTGGASPVVADSTNLGRGPVELWSLPRALQMVVPS